MQEVLIWSSDAAVKVGLLAAQALQVWRDAEVVTGEPVQVQLPLLTTPGLGSAMNILQILFSLCRCPPVHHTASSVHSLRCTVNSDFLTYINSV